MKTAHTNHLWTKQDLRTLVSLWETSTIDEMASKLGVDRRHVIYVASQIRKSHPNLVPSKRKNGRLRHLINETFN